MLFHTDATQAVGKVPVDVIKDDIDLVSISAHKMYGPKGVGALYVRRRNPRVQLTAQMDGGGHERGMRSGTLNVPGIVGFGEACAIAKAEMAEEIEAPGGPARQAEGPAAGVARRDLHQRHHGAPAAEQPEHQLRVRRRRIAADGHQRHRGVERLGLHLGDARAQLRAEGSGRRATIWRTPRSASAWAGSTRKKKSITWRPR